MNNTDAHRLAPILWTLLVIFILRVIGQMLVVLNMQGFLPPMEEWQSGILPYPFLLISQSTIIVFYSKICLDFSRGKGFFAMPYKNLGKGFLIFGTIYLGAMLLRYVLQMIFLPESRWFGGTIPIFVHCVLAAFLILVGNFHWRYSK